jgi:hypothetical protein
VKEYSFTLKFNFSDAGIDPDCYIDRLYEAGCDDALIGVGNQGCIALEFIRSASSAFDAVSSAIVDVKKVIPDASLTDGRSDDVDRSIDRLHHQVYSPAFARSCNLGVQVQASDRRDGVRSPFQKSRVSPKCNLPTSSAMIDRWLPLLTIVALWYCF